MQYKRKSGHENSTFLPSTDTYILPITEERREEEEREKQTDYDSDNQAKEYFCHKEMYGLHGNIHLEARRTV
jgi:hypothetical protein